MDEKIAKQWREILRKAFDKWHDRTLERIKKILNDE